MKKNFGFQIFLSDVISGVLLGHFGPLHLALGSNRKMVLFCSSFSLDTKLKSESLDDLLGSRVQNL